MSVNRYDPTTGSLTNIASGSRIWTGTRAAYDAQKTAGTLPNNAIIVITDDETAMDTVPTEGSPVAVTSDGIYKALHKSNILTSSIFELGNTGYVQIGNIVIGSINAYSATAHTITTTTTLFSGFPKPVSIISFLGYRYPEDVSTTPIVNPSFGFTLKTDGTLVPQVNETVSAWKTIHADFMYQTND